MRGPGFAFQVPQGWRIARPRDAVVGRNGDGIVSVSRFPLLKAYDPAKFDEVAKELDRVAAGVAKQAGATLDVSETVTVAGRRVRAYRYGDKRLGFVLEGRREYQLYCAHAGTACDLLFSSFTLSGPQA